MQQGVRTADKLLKDFCPCSQQGQNQLKMLQNYWLLAATGIHNVENALSVFVEMGKHEVRILKIFSCTFLPAINSQETLGLPFCIAFSPQGIAFSS